MRAGRMFHRVAIQEPVEGQVYPPTEWQNVRGMNRVQCAVTQTRGVETDPQGGQVGQKSFDIAFRYSQAMAQITQDHRIKWGDLILDIEDIENVDMRNRKLIFTCTLSTVAGTTGV